MLLLDALQTLSKLPKVLDEYFSDDRLDKRFENIRLASLSCIWSYIFGWGISCERHQVVDETYILWKSLSSLPKAVDESFDRFIEIVEHKVSFTKLLMDDFNDLDAVVGHDIKLLMKPFGDWRRLETWSSDISIFSDVSINLLADVIVVGDYPLSNVSTFSGAPSLLETLHRPTFPTFPTSPSCFEALSLLETLHRRTFSPSPTSTSFLETSSLLETLHRPTSASSPLEMSSSCLRSRRGRLMQIWKHKVNQQKLLNKVQVIYLDC